MMKRAFPDVPLYFCFGNNDVAETNYQMDCSSEWLEFAYSLWGKFVLFFSLFSSPFSLNSFFRYIPDDQKKTFLQMGAYRVNISHSQQPSVFETKKAPLRLLVLNTMLYSVRSNHKYGLLLSFFFFLSFLSLFFIISHFSLSLFVSFS